MDIDQDRIDEAVLALLWHNFETDGVAWKGVNWQAMERLYERGLISNPVGKTESVQFSDDGLAEGQRLFQMLFTKSRKEGTG